MTVSELRAELQATMEAFAAMIGVSSKSYVADIERTGRCSVRVALRIEELSNGRIPAASLNDDIRLVEEARRVA